MRKSRHMRLLVAGVYAFLLLFGLAPVAASSANISHSYESSENIPNGSIVSIDSKRTDFVQLANTNNGSRVLGVSVASNDSLLAVDPDVSRVQVATSGNVNALVSNLNGNIKVGDQISVSPFNGIGMKAEVGSHVVGLAQTSLSSESDGATTKTVKDKDGNSREILIGYVRISISVGETVSAQGVELNSLQKLAKSWTGHTVSTVRIILALAIAIVATIALITLVYASIYGSIISVGRNPLAKSTIFKSLGFVLAMALMIAAVASALIMLLLR